MAGRFRGRALIAPQSSTIRPTADRLREAIFNVLTHAYEDVVDGARVIDLFAGVGALGLEALSRGAAFAFFVDQGSEANRILRANAGALGVESACLILKRDAKRMGSFAFDKRFNLAFLDPPYGKQFVEPALVSLNEGGWLSPGALCVIEESSAAVIELPQPFTLCERRVYAHTQILFARYSIQDAAFEAPAGAPDVPGEAS